MLFTLMAAATGLALLVIVWALVSRDAEARTRVLEDPSAGLLPGREVVARLFDERDRAYIASLGNPDLERLLERRRTDIAVLWLRTLRQQALAALRDYRTAMRGSESLSFGREVRMLSQMASFLALHAAMLASVRMLGVFRVRGMLTRLEAVGANVLAYADMASAAGVNVSAVAAGGK